MLVFLFRVHGQHINRNRWKHFVHIIDIRCIVPSAFVSFIYLFSWLSFIRRFIDWYFKMCSWRLTHLWHESALKWMKSCSQQPTASIYQHQAKRRYFCNSHLHLTCSIDMYYIRASFWILRTMTKKKMIFITTGAVDEKTKSSIITQIAKTVLWNAQRARRVFWIHEVIFYFPLVWYQQSKTMNFRT